MKKLFIGLKEVKIATDIDKKTYLGNPMVKVVFKQDGEERAMPKDIYDAIATVKPTDATALRDLVAKPLTRKILAALLEADVNLADVDYVLNKVGESVSASINLATERLWGMGLHERTMIDIDDVINDEKKED